MDELDDRRYWLALTACNGIGPIRFQKLLNFFGSAQKAWYASERELVACIGEKMAEVVLDFKKTFSLEEYEEKLQKLQVVYLTLLDIGYPCLLKKIKNPPPVLYKKGTYMFNEKDTLVSVVGTRKITDYGREVTEFLVSDLVAADCRIVSGLAIGVDAVAHKATIDANGRTIAVLGSGVDLCTPAENFGLYNHILENGGAIVSEAPLGQTPQKGSFPSRNRIIAGLSLGVLVTEGAADSGSLITAADAFEYNRKVFAVPGPITSSVSQGPIFLISKGAKMVTTAKDIIDALGIKNIALREKKKNIKGLTEEEKKIVLLLQDQSLHFDELVKRTGFTSQQLGTLVSLLEMKGLVKSIDGGYFRMQEFRK